METKNSKTHHARSCSLPDVPHPLVVQFNEVLCRVKFYETATSSSINNGLSGLLDLHECLSSILLMQDNQKAFARKCNEKEANLILDKTLRILELCGAVKDTLSQAKECTNKLQSLFRRRIVGTAIVKEVKSYLSKRKTVKKSTQRVLRDSKNAKITNKTNDESWMSITSMLSEVEMVNVAVLESLLSFISGSNGQKLSSKWSLVSKVKHSGMTRWEDGSDVNEFTKVDAKLQSLVNTGINKLVQSDNAQPDLALLELTIQSLEQGLDVFYRALIKKRVTLLNILNP